MPETPTTTFRLRPGHRRTLERIARERGLSTRAALELAITHLAGTLKNRQPVYLDDPDDPPGAPALSHKKALGAR